jgi:hypothetical protein
MAENLGEALHGLSGENLQFRAWLSDVIKGDMGIKVIRHVTVRADVKQGKLGENRVGVR